jgi:mannose-6-phosphate isomerase-like protein (cupin superfamily)
MLTIIEPGESVRYFDTHTCSATHLPPSGNVHLPAQGTYYGYALERLAIRHDVRTPDGMIIEQNLQLAPGQFFALAGLSLVVGRCLLIHSREHVGLFQVGGPVESVGRLRYIDGCSDTLLISPPRCGDPCLNHLHFPAGISQTMHTHPSVRIGVVVRGSGYCHTPAGSQPLRANMCWALPANAQHRFVTTDDTLDVVAWHPDSDTGPKDDDHPMLNRTVVDGVPASQLPAIQTAGSIRE